MKPIDLVITGGRIVSPDSITAADVGIDGGRIVAVGDARVMPPAREHIDATGLFVLPGALDVHVHFRDPGFPHKETWESGSRAAAVGGITTVFDMPNTNPPTANAEALAHKKARAQAASLVDFGLYGLIGEDPDLLEPMLRAGASSFKLYMGSENPLVPCPSDGAIVEAMERVAEWGVRITVHAENTPLLERRGARLKAAGRTDIAAHLEQHCDLATVEGVSRTTLFARWTGAKVHIAHESSRHSLPVIRDAKDMGTDVTVETCPHYLLLSTDDAARLGGNFLRVKPPVREPGHAEPLFAALKEGLIDILSTDHAPHLPDEKRRPSIWDTAPGFPGVETSMRLMLSQVARGRMSLCEYVRMACAAPARAFGLYPRKGTLIVGADADIVLVDMAARGTIRGADLHSPGNATPFEGFPYEGAPVRTLVRGRTVARDGRAVGEPGWGRCVADAAQGGTP